LSDRFGGVSMDIIQAPICLEQDSAIDLIVLSCGTEGFSRGRRITTAIIERTSPADPRAVSKKENSCAVDIRPKPSAILFDTDNEARSI
jgi:hypothetical protein